MNDPKPLDKIQHENFCNYIVQGFSQVEAYEKSGYKCSYDSAKNSASDLMERPDIIERIEYLRSLMSEKFGVSKDRILSILNDMMQADPLDVYTVENLKDLPAAVRRCIKKITPSQSGLKIELYSKTEVAEIINKMQGHHKPIAVDLPKVITVKLLDE